MLVKLVNMSPVADPDGGPRVTRFGISADGYDYQPHEDADVLAGKFARHLVANADQTTRLSDVSDGTGDHEAFRAVQYAWPQHGHGVPAGVWSDNPDFAKLLGRFWDTQVLDTDPEAVS